jgi:vancomycin aglycone glucosyltransferase
MIVRVLLSSVGSRGDVQPLLALALKLRDLGHDPRLCIPPDFLEWAFDLDVPATPVGPRLRPETPSANLRLPPPAPPSAEQLRQMAAHTVASQFAEIDAAADGCDVVLSAGALQFAGRSVAERRGIPYVYAAYCPVTLPSPEHAPPPMRGPAVDGDPRDNQRRWDEDAARWNLMFLAALNDSRTKFGLDAVNDVRTHIFTDKPLLAADPMLAPLQATPGMQVTQTGTWILRDTSPLPARLEAFLDAGEPPAYLGFGSMRVTQDINRILIEAVRAIGRRAVVSQGWANLGLVDNDPDCIAISDVNQPALFLRAAAAVHHGGAGTTAAAARAGTPQIIIPQFYDQFYWAKRVVDLGVGVSTSSGTLETESLAAALQSAISPSIRARASVLAGAVTSDGASIAARRLTDCIELG